MPKQVQYSSSSMDNSHQIFSVFQIFHLPQASQDYPFPSISPTTPSPAFCFKIHRFHGWLYVPRVPLHQSHQLQVNPPLLDHSSGSSGREVTGVRHETWEEKRWHSLWGIWQKEGLDLYIYIHIFPLLHTRMIIGEEWWRIIKKIYHKYIYICIVMKNWASHRLEITKHLFVQKIIVSIVMNIIKQLSPSISFAYQLSSNVSQYMFVSFIPCDVLHFFDPTKSLTCITFYCGLIHAQKN